jgi:FKBP-type peptidyl-prolyl cis-trans isomerase
MNFSLALLFIINATLLVKSDALSASHSKTTNRRALFQSIPAAAAILTFASPAALAKCSDIESCREIGERKVEQDMKENPVVNLGSGLRYKVVKPGFGSTTVGSNSNVDLIFSITQASGSYMYSRGFGFEKVNIGGKLQSDAGLDSLKLKIGNKDVPVGLERAIVGMKKGERRRVELPPGALGFDSSAGRPEPTTQRGKTQIDVYKRLLAGNGSTQPGFPAPTIWDVEVLSLK